jgi:hypothetical protein
MKRKPYVYVGKPYPKKVCSCPTCRHKQHPDDKTRTLHELILRFLCTQNERGRRLFAGLVLQWNDMNEKLTVQITGLHPHTIRKGLSELSSRDYRKLSDEGRIREEGGGLPPRRKDDSSDC